MQTTFASYRQWRLAVMGISVLWPASFARSEESTRPVPPKAAEVKQPASELVAQAIAAELKADRPRRGELLDQALLTAPNFAPARWQSGQVFYDQDWMTVDDSIDRAKHDELLAQYREMRSRYGESKEGHLVLAHWCQKHQLSDELRAHATRLLDRSPGDPEAMKLLNVAWYEGFFLTPSEIAARKAAAEYDKALLKKWQPRLSEIRDRLESKSGGERDSAWEELNGIRDPEAIGAIEVVFKNRPALAKQIVQVVGRMPGQRATDLLLREAMLSKREDVRMAACLELRERPLHSYVPTLMGALSKPIETKFDVVRDRDGVHFRKTVRREIANAVVENSLDTDVTLLVPNPNLGAIIGQAYAETFFDAQKTAKAAAALNRKTAEYNNSIYWVLEQTTGKGLPRDPDSWWSWWRSYNELLTSEKPTLANNSYQSVTVPYVAYLPPDIPIYPGVGGGGGGRSVPHHSAPTHSPTTPAAPAPFWHQWYTPGVGLWHYGYECFARGTQVWTQTGMMSIEDIQLGDRVLSQDPTTGELTYKPVLEVTVGNQGLFAIDTSDEQIVASRGHMFWVSGKGWRMAKHLELGDMLHTVSGWTEITRLKELAADETHNLVVADFGTYFVGADRIFVHDITMLKPTTALVPGQPQQ